MLCENGLPTTFSKNHLSTIYETQRWSIHWDKIFYITLMASSAILLTSAFFSKINNKSQIISSWIKCPTKQLSCNKANLQSALNYLCLPGSHTQESVVVGSRFRELKSINAFMKSEPDFKNFEFALYQTRDNYVIPDECREIGDKMADQMFSSYLDKYRHCGLNDTNAVLFTHLPYEEKSKGGMYLHVLENTWNTWRILAVAETYQENLKGYIPSKIVALHELMHVEETDKLSLRKADDGDELLPTLTSIMQIDEIIKKCKQINLDTEFDYNIDLKLNNLSLAIGKIANCYRSLNKDFGNLMQAVLSQKSINFIKTGICQP